MLEIDGFSFNITTLFKCTYVFFLQKSFIRTAMLTDPLFVSEWNASIRSDLLLHALYCVREINLRKARILFGFCSVTA
jgi:hypothetical protein